MAARFDTTKTAITTMDYAGYEGLMTSPLFAVTPMATLDGIVDWLASCGEGERPKVDALPEAVPIVDAGWRETSVRLGHDDSLVAVLCEPVGETRAATAVLVNTSLDHHVGWGRGSVDLARALAQAGFASLRYDGSGVGDSPARPDQDSRQIYTQWRVEDLHSAVEWLDRHGHSRLVLVGRCSGAHLCLYGAGEDKRIVGIGLSNIEPLIHDPAKRRTASLNINIPRSLGEYRRRLFSGVTWRRLARGQINVGASVRNAFLKLAGQGGSVGQEQLALFDQLHQRFDWLKRQAIPVRLVYSHGDPALEQYNRWFDAGRLAANYPNLDVTIEPDADHNFTQRHARRRWHDAIIALMQRVA